LLLAGAVRVWHSTPNAPAPPVERRAAGPPAVYALEAFARRRQPSDRLPVSVLEVLGVLERTFSLEPARSRLLQRRLGSPAGRLYALPTRDGRMCFIVPSGPAGCIASITRKQPNLTVFRPSPRRPAVVFGFVTRDA